MEEGAAQDTSGIHKTENVETRLLFWYTFICGRTFKKILKVLVLVFYRYFAL